MYCDGSLSREPEVERLQLELAELEVKLREEVGESFAHYVDLQCEETGCMNRHYFACGFQMGVEAARGKISSGIQEPGA